MTSPETGTWGHGAVTYPLDATAPLNTLLAAADPALFMALDFYAAALDIHLGARLKAQALLEGIKINHAVEKKLPVRPTRAILADNFRFPMLALYRVNEVHTSHTVRWDKEIGEWGFAYVLPRLSPRQVEQIAPILRGVARTIGHATRQGFEPTYLQGANVWVEANVQSIRLKDVQYVDNYSELEQENGAFFALTGSIEVTERDREVDGAFDPFDGADVTLDYVSEDGTVVESVTSFSTP